MNNTVKNEVAAASQAWIEKFNSGDVAGCIATYENTASMNVYPVGTFIGVGAIEHFWTRFSEQQPSNLVYSNIIIKVIDENTAVLSADWSMNIAHGFISKELWVKNSSGKWQLVEDDFSVLP